MTAGAKDNPEFSVLPASAQKNYTPVKTTTQESVFYLAEGDRGEEVTELQIFLHEKGRI